MFFRKSNAQILKEAQKLSREGKLTDRHISALANPKTVPESISRRNDIDKIATKAKMKRSKSCPPSKSNTEVIQRKSRASEPGVNDHSLETPFGKVFVELANDAYSPNGNTPDQRIIYDSTGRAWSYTDIANILDGLIKTYIQTKNQQNAIQLVEEIYNYVSQPRVETPFPFYKICCTKSTLGLTGDNANAAASLCGILLLSEARKNKALGVWEIGALKTILDRTKEGKSNPFVTIIGEDGDYIQSGHGKTEEAIQMLNDTEQAVNETFKILSNFVLYTPVGINIPIQLIQGNKANSLNHNLLDQYTSICEQVNSMLIKLSEDEDQKKNIWWLLKTIFNYSQMSIGVSSKDINKTADKEKLIDRINTKIAYFNEKVKLIDESLHFETPLQKESFAKLCVILLFDKSNYIKVPSRFIWNFENLKNCKNRNNLSLLGINSSTINGMTPRYKINFDKTERLHIEPAKQSLRDTKGIICKFCHKLIAPNDKHSSALPSDVCNECLSKLSKINFSLNDNIFTIEERRFNLDSNLGNDFNCFWRLLEPYGIKVEIQQLILQYIKLNYAPNFETTGLMDDTHIKYFVEAYNKFADDGTSLYIHLDYYDQFNNTIPYLSQYWGNLNATIKINICLVLTDGGAIGHYIGSV